MNDMQGNYVL